MKILPGNTLCMLLLAAILLFAANTMAADYQGAAAILKQAESASDPDQSSAQKVSPRHQWRLDLKSFKARAGTLPAGESARDWLALFDRTLNLPPAPDDNYGNPVPPRLLELFAALPPPPVWDALAEEVAARLQAASPSDLRTPVLQVVAAMLQGNPDAARKAIDRIKQAAGGQGQKLEDDFLKLRGDKASLLANFEAKLALLQNSNASPAATANAEMLRANSLPVPALVSLAGEAKATALLKQIFALELPGIQVSDKQTRTLARQVALEMGEQLKVPAWDLVDTLDSAPLCALLNRLFPGKSTNDEPDRQKAEAYYLLALISQQHYDEAAALAGKLGSIRLQNTHGSSSELPEEALVDMAGKGYAEEVYQFFDRLLSAHPEWPYWDSYITAAVLAKQTGPMLARVKAATERTDLAPEAHSKLREAYGDALLAADDVAAALPVLLAAASPRTSPPAADAADSRDLREEGNAALKLAGIGQLLGDHELVNQQLDVIVKLAQTQPETVTRLYPRVRDSLSEVFLEAGRGPELEGLLAALLARAEQTMAKRRAQMGGYPFLKQAYAYSEASAPLKALAGLYFHAERYADIVELLDHASDWGVDDVAGLLDGSSGGGSGDQLARALQKTGHPEAALALINRYLEQHGGSDPAYALLLELLPAEKAEARLNELFASDQFEERPLIWRASLQMGQGRLDEAEKSARQAISIDPSDGEEGKGDRMRAYAVLADVLERKGDAEKAGQMRQAVKAIRLSEDADDFRSVGLLTRAVGMYEKALGYFADAYCIQSRLAIQLTALGKLDEAMTHYERAYELMPESFGRLESHCFGCERAFAGEKAQLTAERVFNKLAAEHPENPRVYYLLGYLRNEQERPADAVPPFREAVRLDPDYINAWKQLAAVTDDPAERDRAQLNLLRLDPRRQHDSANLTEINDLPTLWRAVEAAAKFTLPPPGRIYPLAASAAFLEKERARESVRTSRDADATDLSDDAVATWSSFGSHDGPFTPQSVIARNLVISDALSLLPRQDNDISNVIW